MAKQAPPVEILTGRLAQARRLEAKHAGHVAGLEGRQVALREQERGLVKRMGDGADVGRELAKVREAARDLQEELAQAVRIHADLRADVAALEADHQAAERQAKVARLPVLLQRALEQVAGQEDRIRAVLLEVQGALAADIVPAAAEAQHVRAEVLQDGNDLELERRLRTLQHLVASGLAALRK